MTRGSSEKELKRHSELHGVQLAKLFRLKYLQRIVNKEQSFETPENQQ